MASDGDAELVAAIALVTTFHDVAPSVLRIGTVAQMVGFVVFVECACRLQLLDIGTATANRRHRLPRHVVGHLVDLVGHVPNRGVVEFRIQIFADVGRFPCHGTGSAIAAAVGTRCDGLFRTIDRNQKRFGAGFIAIFGRNAEVNPFPNAHAVLVDEFLAVAAHDDLLRGFLTEINRQSTLLIRRFLTEKIGSFRPVFQVNPCFKSEILPISEHTRCTGHFRACTFQRKHTAATLIRPEIIGIDGCAVVVGCGIFEVGVGIHVDAENDDVVGQQILVA